LSAGAVKVDDSVQEKLVGTWKLASAKYNGQDYDLKKVGTTLKHITPGNFIWVSYDSESKEVSRTAGGKYTLKGDKYAETPQYGLGADFKAIRDNAHEFTLKLEGDKWHHKGTLSNGITIEEVWERVKPE